MLVFWGGDGSDLRIFLSGREGPRGPPDWKKIPVVVVEMKFLMDFLADSVPKKAKNRHFWQSLGGGQKRMAKIHAGHWKKLISPRQPCWQTPPLGGGSTGISTDQIWTSCSSAPTHPNPQAMDCFGCPPVQSEFMKNTSCTGLRGT